MPFIDLTTSADPGLPILDKLSEDVTSLVEKHLGKPEGVTMVRISAGQRVLYKGNHEPTAHLAVNAIGLAPAEGRSAFVSAVSELFDAVLDVPSDRCFVVFDGFPADQWGVGGALKG